MNINIAKENLKLVRSVLSDRLRHHSPRHSEFHTISKVIRKINRALVTVYGHDCNGKYYLTDW